MKLLKNSFPDPWFPHEYRMILEGGCKTSCLYCEAKERIRREKLPSNEELQHFKTKVKNKSLWIGCGNGEIFAEPNKKEKLSIFKEFIEQNHHSNQSSLTVFTKHPEYLLDFKVTGALCYTLPSFENAILNVLEPNSPSFRERINTLNLLKKKGWEIEIGIIPIIKGLNSDERQLSGLFETFKELANRIFWKSGNKYSWGKTRMYYKGLSYQNPKDWEEEFFFNFFNLSIKFKLPLFQDVSKHKEKYSLKNFVSIILGQLYYLSIFEKKPRDAYRIASFYLNKCSEADFNYHIQANSMQKIKGIGDHLEKIIISIIRENFLFYEKKLKIWKAS